MLLIAINNRLLRSPLNYILMVVLSAFLIGCGGGDSGTSSTPSTTSPSSPTTPVSPTTYAIHITTTGLDGRVTLVKNGTDTLYIDVNGSATFAGKLTSGDKYSVAVVTQPTSSVKCNIDPPISGNGTITNADITLSLVCVGPAVTPVYPSFCGQQVYYSAIVPITGLGGRSGLGLTMTTNCGSSLTTSTTVPYPNDTFTWSALPNGSTYVLTIYQQPSGLICTVYNGTITIVNANSTSTSIDCKAQ